MKLLSIILLLTSIQALSQDKPSWINPVSRKVSYPEKTHIVGFSSQFFSKTDDLNKISEKVKSLARAALSESIQMKINSTSTASLQNENGDGTENYSKSVVTSSQLKTTGLKTETFIDHKKGVAYALTYVTKKKLITSHFIQLNASIKEVKRSLDHAAEIENKGEAYIAYMDVVKALDGLKSTQHLLRTLGATNDIVLKEKEWQNYHRIADEQAEKLRRAEDISIMEAAHFLTDKLIQELDDKSATIIMGNITYKSTNMGSELSERMRLLMLENFRKKGIKVSQSIFRGGVQYFLDGSYWPGTTKVQISAEIKEQHDSEVVRLVSGGTVFVSTEALDLEGIMYEPQAKEEAIQTNQIIVAGALPDEGMHAELWTNKPGSAQIFTEGDKLMLSVRVNQPAYLRLINVWNDGQVLLLLDNEWIDGSKANQVIELDQQFITQCPCGVEYLQLLAQNEKFSTVSTFEQDGFTFVKESLKSVLKKSRASGNSEGSFSEQVITVTTLSK